MSCPCLYFSFSLFLAFSLSVYPLSSPLLAKGKEKRYTCKRCGRTCVYEARLYTYESRRISGHTTGAEISFIYPRLPASLLTVYLQHLIHHSRIVCGYSGARVCACVCTPRFSRAPDGDGMPSCLRWWIFLEETPCEPRGWNANVARPFPWKRLSDAAH